MQLDVGNEPYLSKLKYHAHYRPRSEGDNVLGSVRLSVRPSVRPCPLSRLNRTIIQERRLIGEVIIKSQSTASAQLFKSGDRLTDGCYKVHYLPASLSYVVDKNTGAARLKFTHYMLVVSSALYKSAENDIFRQR